MDGVRRTFEITFVDTSGNPIGNPTRPDTSNAIPVLDVMVCAPGTMTVHGERCKALIDTGADHAVAAISVINSVEGTLLGAIENRGVSGKLETTLHDVTFMLTDTCGNHHAIHSDCVATNDPHPAYKVILGRSLLRHGSLVLDYLAGRFEFKL